MAYRPGAFSPAVYPFAFRNRFQESGPDSVVGLALFTLEETSMTPIVIEPEKDFRDALRCEAYIGAMHDYAHARAQETDRPVLQAVRTCLSYAISSRQYCVEQAFHVLYETMIQLDDQQRLFQCALCDAVPQMYKYQVEHDPGCLIPQLWVFQKLDTSSFVHKILTRTDPSRST